MKKISSAVAGDSSLQDRGVACYPLPLHFSLVSLLFSFCFRVLYQKPKKIVALFLLVVVAMGSTENTMLGDFTSHNNNDYTFSSIAPVTTKGLFTSKPCDYTSHYGELFP